MGPKAKAAKKDTAPSKAKERAPSPDHETPSQTMEGLEMIKQAVQFLKKRKQWPSQGSKEGSVSGLSVISNKFKGSQVEKVAHYLCCLADVDLNDQNTFPTCKQIEEWAAYWWSEGKVFHASPLMVHAFCTEDSERGSLMLAEDSGRILSFVFAYARECGLKLPDRLDGDDVSDDEPPAGAGGDGGKVVDAKEKKSQKEKLAKYYQIASTCQLILTRVHAGEHRILRVIQAAEDLSQRVQEFGNQLPMLYASRLIMLRDSLRAAGQASTLEALLAHLREIKFGSEETRIKTTDMIQKLISTREKACKAGIDCLTKIQECQVLDQDRTWIGKWSVLTRVAAALKTPSEFRFVMLLICQGMQKGNEAWRHLKKDQAMEVAQMQQLKFQLLLKLQKVNAGGESDGWKAWIEKLLDPATFEKGQHLLLGEAGLMDERLSSAGKLAFAFVLGTHDRMLLSAIQSGQKESYPQLESLMKEAVDKANIVTAAAQPSDEAAGSGNEEGNGDDDVIMEDPSSNLSAKKKRKSDMIAAAVQEELRFYAHFLVCDYDDPAQKTSLLDSLQHHKLVKDHDEGRDAETVSRLWVYDSNLLVEPNGSGLCRSFNPYVKPPVFHKVAFTNFKAVYQSCATDSDVLAVCDGGSVKGTAEVKKAMSAMGAFSTSIFLIPDQDSMQTRKDFSKKRQSDAAAAKRRKTLGVGELGFGSERLWIARRSDYVKSREHKFLKTSGINSTASGFLQIPSVDPKDLFCVQREVKETVMPAISTRHVLSDEKPEVLTADIAPSQMTPMNFFERPPVFWKSLLHTCWDPQRVIIFSVGDGSFALESIRQRRPCLLICRNSTQKKYVLKHMAEKLTVWIGDVSDERFYRKFGTADDASPPPVLSDHEGPGESERKKEAETETERNDEAEVTEEATKRDGSDTGSASGSEEI